MKGNRMIQGTIIRVAGPVVDVKFTEGKLPALQEALTVTAEGTERTMEVAQHVNETTVRCIMLSASEGLGKGMVVTATGPSTARLPALLSRNLQPRSWRPASRSSTCWLLTPRAARSACSAAPAWARLC